MHDACVLLPSRRSDLDRGGRKRAPGELAKRAAKGRAVSEAPRNNPRFMPLRHPRPLCSAYAFELFWLYQRCVARQSRSRAAPRVREMRGVWSAAVAVTASWRSSSASASSGGRAEEESWALALNRY